MIKDSSDKSLPQLVDSHVHFWDPQVLDYPWLKTIPPLDCAYLPQEYASDAEHANVTKMVFVECGCRPELSINEVKWITKLATGEKRLCAIVARASLELGIQVRDELEALAQFPLVKGVRRNFEDETETDFCLQPAFLSAVRELTRFDFSLDICVRHGQLPAVVQLARACPDVRFVLDHCGKPDICHQLIDPWRQHISDLAELSNVSCKISGLLTEAKRQQWVAEDFRPYVFHILENFGLDRVMIGGDWPVLKLSGQYLDWLDVLQYCLAGVNDQDLSKLYQTNAETFYRLD